MADVDWDKVVWDEPNEGGDEEAQAKARYQERLRQLLELGMGDAVAWDGPRQSTPVEEIHKVATAMAHAIQQQTTAPLSDSSRLVVGDHVRVKDGTFAGFEGPVREVLEAKNQVRLQLSAFRHLATLDLEYWQVERIPPAEQRPLPEEVKKVVQWADRHGCLEDTVPGHAEWARREGISSEVEKSVQRLEVQALLAPQGTAPLAESLHPGNEGPYLLDEEGDIRTLKATACPESLHVRIGNLEIQCPGKPSGAFLPFYASRILVDGKPFPVKSLVLRGNVDGLWTVELEFYPHCVPKQGW
jgi:hypothetical protein